MADLSPRAQAVFWAFNSKFSWVEDGVPGPQFKSIAAALRAAAGELSYGLLGVQTIDSSQLLLLADELEACD
jgi:hypothetical protein